MSIFDEDDSDAGSEISSISSDSWIESDEELAQEESDSSIWPKPYRPSGVKTLFMRSNDSEDEEDLFNGSCNLTALFSS